MTTTEHRLPPCTANEPGPFLMHPRSYAATVALFCAPEVPELPERAPATFRPPGKTRRTRKAGKRHKDRRKGKK
jgi:hypothetical protein